MANLYGKKGKRVFAAILAGILILAMVIPLLFSVL
jgi:hypothetical protein